MRRALSTDRGQAEQQLRGEAAAAEKVLAEVRERCVRTWAIERAEDELVFARASLRLFLEGRWPLAADGGAP